jgi:hypothetical protein
VNKAGHPATLRAAHLKNQNALRSGVFCARVLEPRAREIAEQLADAATSRPLKAWAPGGPLQHEDRVRWLPPKFGLGRLAG